MEFTSENSSANHAKKGGWVPPIKRSHPPPPPSGFLEVGVGYPTISTYLHIQHPEQFEVTPDTKRVYENKGSISSTQR